LFKAEENVAILVRNRHIGTTIQRITKADTISSPQFQSWLENQNVAGSDIFIGMNPIKDGAYSRTKDNIKDIRHVYLDLDRNGDESIEAIRTSFEVPAPNFVLDTSPGKHQVVWKVAEVSQDKAESLLHSLANQFDGDLAATDTTRVLRLPGFANRKLPQEFIIQARHETNAVYTLRDFAIHDDSLEQSRYRVQGEQRKRTMPAEHRSQSEDDWAFAKRALARGDDPETVIKRIADYRADEKHDPEYYARLTVTKAQAAIKDRQFAGHTSSSPDNAADIPSVSDCSQHTHERL
jgi:hypothetical protein